MLSGVNIGTIIGKVQLYLTSLSDADRPFSVEEELIRAKRRVEELEEEIGNANSDELLPSILNNICKRLETYAEQLKLENSDARLRFDLNNLTIIADTENGPVPLARMGSGANWLGYHLATHIALHDWFIQRNRPVPRFPIPRPAEPSILSAR